MLSDELIEKLKDVQKRAGRPLPVIMFTSGDVDVVEIGFDSIQHCDEIWLRELAQGGKGKTR